MSKLAYPKNEILKAREALKNLKEKRTNQEDLLALLMIKDNHTIKSKKDIREENIFQDSLDNHFKESKFNKKEMNTNYRKKFIYENEKVSMNQNSTTVQFNNQYKNLKPGNINQLNEEKENSYNTLYGKSELKDGFSTQMKNMNLLEQMSKVKKSKYMENKESLENKNEENEKLDLGLNQRMQMPFQLGKPNGEIKSNNNKFQMKESKIVKGISTEVIDLESSQALQYEKEAIKSLQYKEQEICKMGDLVQCQYCQRKFNCDSLQKHEKVCKEVFIKKREKFDSSEVRTKGNEVKTKPESQALKKKDGVKSFVNKEPKWKKESEQFRKALKNNPGSNSNNDDINFNEKDESDDSLVECHCCKRKFAPETAKRHIPFCEKRQKDNAFRVVKPKK